MSAELKNFYPPNPATARAQSTQIDVDPKGEKIAYVSGKSVIIRDIKEPGKAIQYTQHMVNPTVARFSPTGTYVASGDANGNVKIWDMTKEEQTLRYETRVVSGPVKDIAWDAEGKRIMAVGDGKDRFGHVFLSDTGNTVGEISGHSKVLNACSLRPVRPYRGATGSDDNTVIFYNGPPYRYERVIKDHQRFVQAVKFSPNGDYFATAGADALIFLYDGKTGDKIDRIGAEGEQHSSTITAISWSPDSTQLISSSTDHTVKVWDISTRKCTQTFQLNPTGDSSLIGYQQVGVVWAKDAIISLSLNGELNYLDVNSTKPVRVIPGNQQSVTDLHVTSENTWISTDFDGKFLAWTEEQDPKLVGDNSQPKQVVASGKYPVSNPSTIVSVGVDNSVKVLDINTQDIKQSSNLKNSSLSKSLVIVDDKRYLSTDGNKLNLIDSSSLEVISSYEYVNDIESISISSNLELIAIGGGPKAVQILSFNGNQFDAKHTIGDNLASTVSFVSFSPNGQLLAIGDTRGKIKVFDVEKNEPVIHHWIHHTARIYSIEWSQCGKYAISASLDTNVFVWSVEKPMKRIGIMRAHIGGASRASFLTLEKVVTAGADGSIKVWNLTHH